MIEFTVLGEPVAKARPRVFGKRTITPSKTANYEAEVAFVAGQAFKGCEYLQGPLQVVVRIFMSIPKSARKRDLPGMLDGTIRPTKRPDVDNIVKSITDAMESVIYANDSAIVQLWAEKFYSDTPRVEVRVSEASVGVLRTKAA